MPKNFMSEAMSNYAKTPDDIADEVIRGYWGNGDDRVKRLEDAGYDYAIIQNIMNRKLTARMFDVNRAVSIGMDIDGDAYITDGNGRDIKIPFEWFEAIVENQKYSEED